MMEAILVTAVIILLMILRLWQRSDHIFPLYPRRPRQMLDVFTPGMGLTFDSIHWNNQRRETCSSDIDNPLEVVANRFGFINDPQPEKAADFSDTKPVFFDATRYISMKREALPIDHACDDHLSLVMMILGKFAIGQNILTETVKKMESSSVNYLTSVEVKLADTRTRTNINTFNVICSIIIGRKFDYHDEEFQNLLANLNSTALDWKDISLINYFSWLKCLSIDLSMANKMRLNVQMVLSLLKKYIAVKRHKGVYGNDAENFIEAYLAERKKTVVSGVSTHVNYGSLTKIINELFGPESGTARMTIYRWGLQRSSHLYIQDKVGRKIKKHTTPDKPSHKQSNINPPTEVIADTHWLANTAPLSLLHTCSEDATLNTSSILKETHVKSKLGSVLFDKRKSSDIMTLNPERFLDANCNLQDHKKQIPCIMGQRVALGETKKKIELFMFFGNAFHRC